MDDLLAKMYQDRPETENTLRAKKTMKKSRYLNARKFSIADPFGLKHEPTMHMREPLIGSILVTDTNKSSLTSGMESNLKRLRDWADTLDKKDRQYFDPDQISFTALCFYKDNRRRK